MAQKLETCTRKGNPIEVVWNETRDQAFQELKRRISTPPILKLPDVTKPFILQTDASHIGIGAVLLQEDAAGEKILWHLQAGSCNLETPTTLRLSVSVLP